MTSNSNVPLSRIDRTIHGWVICCRRHPCNRPHRMMERKRDRLIEADRATEELVQFSRLKARLKWFATMIHAFPWVWSVFLYLENVIISRLLHTIHNVKRCIYSNWCIFKIWIKKAPLLCTISLVILKNDTA